MRQRHEDWNRDSLNITYCNRSEPIAAPWLFKNRDWVVNNSGLHHRKYDLMVETDYVVQVYECSRRTVRSFNIEPWPFWFPQLGLNWLKDGATYTEAFTFALGHLSMCRWDAKAEAQRIVNGVSLSDLNNDTEL